MTRDELVIALARRLGMPEHSTRVFLHAFFDEAKSAVRSGETLKLSGLGVWETPASKGNNPKAPIFRPETAETSDAASETQFHRNMLVPSHLLLQNETSVVEEVDVPSILEELGLRKRISHVAFLDALLDSMDKNMETSLRSTVESDSPSVLDHSLDPQPDTHTYISTEEASLPFDDIYPFEAHREAEAEPDTLNDEGVAAQNDVSQTVDQEFDHMIEVDGTDCHDVSNEVLEEESCISEYVDEEDSFEHNPVMERSDIATSDDYVYEEPANCEQYPETGTAASPDDATLSDSTSAYRNDEVFYRNRDQLYHPPEKRRSKLLMLAALVLTAIVIAIVFYMIYGEAPTREFPGVDTQGREISAVHRITCTTIVFHPLS